MGLFKKIGLVLKESIVSPSTESYIIEKGSETLVVRSGGNYEGIDLSGVDLSATRLNNANFRGANLKEAKLDHADLTNTDLTNANLSGTTISGTHFELSKLDGADISGVTYIIPPSGVSAEVLQKIKEDSSDE